MNWCSSTRAFYIFPVVVQPSRTGITDGSVLGFALKCCLGLNICLESNTTQRYKIGPCLETKSQHAALQTKPAVLASTVCLLILHWFIPGSHKRLQMRECLRVFREQGVFPSPGRTDLMIRSFPVSLLSPSPQQTEGVFFSCQPCVTLCCPPLLIKRPGDIALAKKKVHIEMWKKLDRCMHLNTDFRKRSVQQCQSADTGNAT